jgi:hypothetical protein
MPAEMTDRRFPPPWSIEEFDECFASKTRTERPSVGVFLTLTRGNRARPSTGGSRAMMCGVWQ